MRGNLRNEGDATRDTLRLLTGNEIKILIAALYLRGDQRPLSPEDIASEAGIGRSTVYRLLPGLTAKRLLAVSLTETGAILARNAARAIEQPDAEPPGIPKWDGVTSQNGTRIPVWDSPHDQILSQNGTETVITQPGKDSNSSEPANGLPDNLRRFALDLAKQSHKALREKNSLGYHILVWSAALKHDRDHQNRDIEDSLVSLCRKLCDRHAQTGKHQGAAWTAATRQILNAHGISLSRSAK